MTGGDHLRWCLIVGPNEWMMVARQLPIDVPDQAHCLALVRAINVRVTFCGFVLRTRDTLSK